MFAKYFNLNVWQGFEYTSEHLRETATDTWYSVLVDGGKTRQRLSDICWYVS